MAPSSGESTPPKTSRTAPTKNAPELLSKAIPSGLFPCIDGSSVKTRVSPGWASRSRAMVGPPAARAVSASANKRLCDRFLVFIECLM